MTSPDAPTRNLTILAADESEDALRPIVAVLEGLGHHVTGCAATVSEALEAIARQDPDASVVVVHDDVDHALTLIEELHDISSGPVVAVLASSNGEVIRAAAERGISAVASGIVAEDLQSALEVAMHRHSEAIRLSARVGQLEHALERRALIERAKGILMERHGLDENQAFDVLRACARRERLQVVTVAREVADGDRDVRPS